MASAPVKDSAENQPFAGFDWLLLLAAAGIWGSSFYFTDIALRAEHPGLITWLRVLFGFCTIMVFPASRRSVEATDHKKLLLLGVTWMAFPLTLFPIAQQWINSSLTGMLNSAMPVMAVIVGATVFNTPTHRKQLTGVAVGILGILMIGLPAASGDTTTALGVILVVAAVSSYGVAVHIAGPLQRKYGSLAVLSRVLAVAVVAVTPYGIVGLLDSTWAVDAVVSNLILGVGGTGFAFVAAATLTGRVGAVRMSIVTYLVPVVAIVLGLFLLDETLQTWQLVGSGTLIVGAWMTTRPAE
ncbi:MAG: DMT family transporter [Actinobacteria bacterium]|jgi:drug/metabolite transporter (DMT)-like permease|nr:DMT family transporter [Actinomycetota bacterium]MBT3747318.1 DMT family transporter [Actinomycetota bacterium]MBT3970458.1 DMT family transporter [Actinomycetota bacterium]MBT4009691.1 DMT family transporter [Actinomycetota bacterium]MBT4302870.1 DMT family transporter [Actinomycetota bacterium]